jgi:(p)ppGpp synthase/HD superfamily hydrolase
MDESLYRGFDERAHVFFTALMERVDKVNPHRKTLWEIFSREVIRCLPLTKRDEQRLERAFNFTYRAHKNTPIRESGEAYIFHLVRSSLVIVWAQQECKVFDLEMIIVDLLHDSVEEAKSAYHSSLERYSRLLEHSRVRLNFGWRTARDVYTLTKHKESGETSDMYCERLTISEEWRPLAVKVGGDRTDNMWTIDAVSPERRANKIRETKRWFPRIIERLNFLVEREIAHGRLAPTENWRNFVKFIAGYLWYAVGKKDPTFPTP